MARQIKGAPALAKQFADKGVWTKVVLPSVVMLEGWNLQNAVKAFMKSEGISNRQLVDLAGAVADSTAIAASVNQARLQSAHHKAEQMAGKKLTQSKQLIKATRWARGIGAGAGAFSAGLSFYDMIRNTNEGDDAAIAHGVMASGFTIVTMSEIAGFAAAYGAKGLIIEFLAGPIGWIGLAVVLAGAALLSWVFTEDTPLEEWLANGPFSHKQDLNLSHPHGRNRQAGERERFVADDGSQLLLGQERRVLGIGAVNQSFGQDEEGIIYQTQEDGEARVIGRIGEPFNVDQFADRSNRFAGFDENDEVDGKFHIWKVKPISAYQSLLSAIFTPTGEMHLRRQGANPWVVELTLHIPQYIDNVSLLKIEMWQTLAGSKTEEQVYKQMYLSTPDQGSGPRSVMLVEPLLDQVNGKVRAVIKLDIYGTGEVVLPLPEPSWSEADEVRRQHLLAKKRIAPVGEVNVEGVAKQEQATTAKAPKLDKTEALALTAGPPPSDEPDDDYKLAP
jgi:hypothetical protein